MKRIIALIAAFAMILSLTACFGSGGTKVATADEVKALSEYKKDFDGLKQYLYDYMGLKGSVDSKTGENSSVMEIYYDMIGADNGVRYSINGNAYIEIYDFSSAKTDKAKEILADVKDDGKFTPLENGTQMTATITDSGKYVIAWDATRGYEYQKNLSLDTIKANW